jgi:hypothetical protein
MRNNSFSFLSFPAFLLIVPMFIIGCGSAGENQSSESERQNTDSLARVDSIRVADSLHQLKVEMVADSFPKIGYTRLAITDRKTLDSIRKMYARDKDNMGPFRAITTLNRKEFGYIRVGDTIVTPDSIMADLRAYSIFPYYYPGADTIPKIIMVSNKYQAYACYENGQLIRFAACNTGTEGKPTLPGRYALNWKERLRISSLNDNWKLPFTWNFHLYAGNAFHQFDMPGRPVSHSCVRQFMPDAQWLYEWGRGAKRDSNGTLQRFTGTPVIIIDIFDFARKKGGPWLELTSNQDATLELPADPMAVEEALIPISQVPHSARGSLGKDREKYLTAEDTLRARGIIRPEARLSPSIDYNARRKAKAAAATRRSTDAADKPAPKPAATPKVDAE